MFKGVSDCKINSWSVFSLREKDTQSLQNSTKIWAQQQADFNESPKDRIQMVK